MRVAFIKGPELHLEIVFADFLFLPYAILTSHPADCGDYDTLEVISMSTGQTQYLYTVELAALEENLSHSMERVLRLREKAIRRNDLKATDQISQLQRSLDVAKRRITRLK
jgi:hypothetical protein